MDISFVGGFDLIGAYVAENLMRSSTLRIPLSRATRKAYWPSWSGRRIVEIEVKEIDRNPRETMIQRVWGVS